VMMAPSTAGPSSCTDHRRRSAAQLFRILSINPVMNFGLPLVVFFAQPVRMYDIELPSFLARYTSGTREPARGRPFSWR